MKLLKVLLTVFLYLILVLLWRNIFYLLLLLRAYDGFLDDFCDGALLIAFAIIFVTGILITIRCRKKMKYQWMLPLFLIASTILTTAVNCGILYAAHDYISVYTREKWDKYPFERGSILDSLNEQYNFIGMTEQEVKEILGEPNKTSERDSCTIYQYIVGGTFNVLYAYDFTFDNGVVVETSYVYR